MIAAVSGRPLDLDGICCVAFDFDGTIVDSNKIKEEGFLKLASDFPGGPAVMADILIRPDVGDRYRVLETFCQSMRELGCTDLPTEAGLADQYTSMVEQLILQTREIDGATDCLCSLRESGLAVYLNSATPVWALTSIVRQSRYAGLFKGIYGSPASKAENLRRIMALESIGPDRLLMVGDGEADQVGADIVGCHFIALENNHSRFTTRPPLIIPDLTGLASLLGIRPRQFD